MPTDVRRARVAVTIAFATNGALPATLLARYAEVKDLLTLSDATFGLLVAGYAVGAAAALNLPGIVLRRIGTRATTTAGTAWVAVCLLLATLGVSAGNIWLVLAGLALAGWADAIVDVAQNAQGLAVQAARGSSVLNSMHAGWSVGAAAGGVVGTLAATAAVPLPVHLGGWGLACVTAMTLAGRAFLPDRSTAGADGTGRGEGSGDAPARASRRPNWFALRLLLPLGLLALAGMSVEDVGSNWSAVLLATERGVPLGSAGIGLSALLIAQFIGRMLGDRFVDGAGEHTALMTSLIGMIAGLLLLAWVPSATLTVAGFALAGLSSAITIPLAFARADQVPGLRPHSGVTWIALSIRVTAIGMSPAIGAMSSASSLPLAITVVAAASVLALVAQIARRPRP